RGNGANPADKLGGMGRHGCRCSWGTPILASCPQSIQRAPRTEANNHPTRPASLRLLRAVRSPCEAPAARSEPERTPLFRHAAAPQARDLLPVRPAKSYLLVVHADLRLDSLQSSE